LKAFPEGMMMVHENGTVDKSTQWQFEYYLQPAPAQS
jgi:hypothetical protein